MVWLWGKMSYSKRQKWRCIRKEHTLTEDSAALSSLLLPLQRCLPPLQASVGWSHMTLSMTSVVQARGCGTGIDMWQTEPKPLETLASPPESWSMTWPISWKQNLIHFLSSHTWMLLLWTDLLGCITYCPSFLIKIHSFNYNFHIPMA